MSYGTDPSNMKAATFKNFLHGPKCPCAYDARVREQQAAQPPASTGEPSAVEKFLREHPQQVVPAGEQSWGSYIDQEIAALQYNAKPDPLKAAEAEAAKRERARERAAKQFEKRGR